MRERLNDGRPTPNHQQTGELPAIDRRTLLRAVAAGTVLSALDSEKNGETYDPHIVRVENLDNGPRFSLRPQDFSTDPKKTVPLPSTVANPLRKDVASVNNFLTPATRITNLELYKIDPIRQKTYFNAHPDWKANTVTYELYPNTTYPHSRVKQAFFHEVMHSFIFQGKDPLVIYGKDGVVSKYYDYLEARSPQGVLSDQYDSLPPAARTSLDLTKMGLFPLFDESSYRREDGGSPYMGFDELIASSYTIMRFYPKSLISTLGTLNPVDRKVTVNYMDHLLRTGRSIATNPDAFSGHFSKSLTNYIGKEKAIR